MGDPIKKQLKLYHLLAGNEATITTVTIIMHFIRYTTRQANSSSRASVVKRLNYYLSNN